MLLIWWNTLYMPNDVLLHLVYKIFVGRHKLLIFKLLKVGSLVIKVFAKTSELKKETIHYLKINLNCKLCIVLQKAICKSIIIINFMLKYLNLENPSIIYLLQTYLWSLQINSGYKFSFDTKA